MALDVDTVLVTAGASIGEGWISAGRIGSIYSGPVCSGNGIFVGSARSCEAIHTAPAPLCDIMKSNAVVRYARVAREIPTLASSPDTMERTFEAGAIVIAAQEVAGATVVRILTPAPIVVTPMGTISAGSLNDSAFTIHA